MPEKYLVIGCGKTGLSCLRFLLAKGHDVCVFDTRKQPPLLSEVYCLLPSAQVYLQDWEDTLLHGVDSLVISPGVSMHTLFVEQARAQGIPVIGDIELFYRHAEAPIVAITGSNGKSTVTTLLAHMAKASGLNMVAGGNLGEPALDLLAKVDGYLLELSSFQLESVRDFTADVSVILNISPDHMDRYPDVATYQKTKERVYRGTGIRVINKDIKDFRVYGNKQARYFTMGKPLHGEYGQQDGWLMRGSERLLPIASLPLAGGHNVSNVLAAFCLGEAVGLSIGTMKAAVLSFQGLPHRLQNIAEKDGVQWFDDSKGTNVGAATAAVKSMAGRVVLIAGGVAKESDFSLLVQALREQGRAVILIGHDAPQLGRAFEAVLPVVYASSMEAAVKHAAQWARAGDAVLLSPACASFDMFKNYIERGLAFQAAVRRQPYASEVAA